MTSRAPALPSTSGRSNATAAVRAGDRPVSRSRVARSSRSCRRTRHGQTLPDDRQVGFVELLRAANDRGEQEERETEHEEHVADRGDVLDDRGGGSG